MELKVIRKLEAQDKYCCKEGVLELGIEGKPTLGNIWCCAKCGHPVEPSAQHPVIVELCKDLVKDYWLKTKAAKLVRIDTAGDLVLLIFVNGEFASVCPKTYQVKDDVIVRTGQQSIGSSRLEELLDFAPPTSLEGKLVYVLTIYMLNAPISNQIGI